MCLCVCARRVDMDAESKHGAEKLQFYFIPYHSVSHSVCPTLRPHGLQHSRLPCPSPTQTHVHRVGDAIQSSHPLSSPSPVFSLSKYHSLFQWVGSSHQVDKVSASASALPMNVQDWFPLGWTGWISLQSKGLSRVSSNITVQKHQFFSTQLSLQSNSHIHTWLLEKP